MTDKKTCFVIAPIGQEGSETRKRSDSVLKHIFRDALIPKGYSVVRADEIAEPGSITVQVIERVINADLVIADLTDHNPNVFYELAVRHAVQKPLIHTIASDQAIPFDVADFRTVPLDLDLDGAAKARSGIAAQLEEIEKGSMAITPVKMAGVLIDLAKSRNPGDSEGKLVLRQVIEGLSEIRVELRTSLDTLAARTEKTIAILQTENAHMRQLADQRLMEEVRAMRMEKRNREIEPVRSGNDRLRELMKAAEPTLSSQTDQHKRDLSVRALQIAKQLASSKRTTVESVLDEAINQAVQELLDAKLPRPRPSSE